MNVKLRRRKGIIYEKSNMESGRLYKFSVF